MALLEHTIYDPQNGAPINSNLADYLMSVNADAPLMEVHFLDYPDTDVNPLGARGIGEIRAGRRRGCDRSCYLSRHRRARARTANQDRGSAHIFDFGLTMKALPRITERVAEKPNE